jgi:hypothetical protein
MTLLHCLKRRHRGRENAVKSPVLETRFKITGKALRDLVNELRCGEHPICSDENGYYYVATEAELSDSIQQLSNRIATIAKAKNGLVRAARRYAGGGQTRLPL